jgi:hypothetical protein
MAKAAPIHGLDRQAPLLVNAAIILSTRLDEMMQFEPSLHDPEQVYELHQMRIAAKRLRYTMDIFKPVYTEFSRFGAEFAEVIETVKALQEHLGEIHDADVLVPQLTEQLDRLLKVGYGEDEKGRLLVGVHLVDFDSCQGLLQLCMETQKAREKRYLAAQRDWQKYQDAQVFERLRGLLAVVCDEAIKRTRTETETANRKTEGIANENETPGPAEMEETAHGKDTRTDTEDVRSPSPAGSGRRARTARTPPNAGRHSGPGTDSSARSVQSRNGQSERPPRRAAGKTGGDSGNE